MSVVDFMKKLIHEELSADIGLEKSHSRIDSKPFLSDSFIKVKKWSHGSDYINAIIQGDNLEVLRELKKTHCNSVRCIYLDPPYNNGDSYRHYLDNMGHEEWLSSVSQRLLALKPLLTDDGALWISIDDSEVHYLKVAADNIFGRENFITTVIWERRTTRENRKAFSRNHEYILVYAKNAKIWAKKRNGLELTEEISKRYKNPDNDPRGPWQSVSANVQDGHATPQQFYSITSPSGIVHTAPKGRCWVYSEKRMKEEVEKNNIWFGVDGKSVPRIKKFLTERSGGVTPETLWKADEVGTTTTAKKHLHSIFNETTLFDTPKPEQLIKLILHISTNSGDLVLDPYLGSGSTASVAMKMNRKFIGIEIGDHSKTHCSYRLKKVCEGELGGISKDLNWQGTNQGFTFYKFNGSD